MNLREPLQILRPPERRRIPGFSDLLAWLMSPLPGVILCKDGSLLAGYYFVGRDLTTLSNHERNVTSLTLASAIHTLGGGWSVHVDATRLPSDTYPPRRDWPEPISQRIDEERRAQFETHGTAFETIQTLVLRWSPPSSLHRRTASFLLEREVVAAEQDLAQCLGAFEEALSVFEDTLANTLSLTRMRIREDHNERRTDELWTHLRWTLTGEAVSLAPRLPTIHLDTQTACPNFQCSSPPRFGDEWLGIISIDDLPDATYPNLLHDLQALPFPARWNTRFVALDEHDAKRELRTIRTKWSQQTRGWLDRIVHPQPTANSVINQDAVNMQDETEALLSTLNTGRVGLGYTTSVVVLRNPDREVLQQQARTVRQLLQQHGFAARIEDVNAVEGFLGSLPGHVVENVRSRLVDTQTLANLLPLSSTWLGPSRCPSDKIEHGHAPPLVICRTEGSTPFRFSLHVQDVGHTLLFGPSGTGKSTLIALFCAQWLRYENATVVAIDKDLSLRTLTQAVGGSHHVLSVSGGSERFAPFDAIDDPAERAWAADWIEDLCRVQGVEPSLAQREEIRKALQTTAETGGQRTFSAIAVAIQDTEIKLALQPYYASGDYGAVFDGESDSIQHQRWTCIELAAVMAASDKLRLPALTYLFRIVERQAHGQPLLLVIDEAWAALKHDAFRAKVREWLVTLRKKNVAVLLATQSVGDIANSDLQQIITENCPTRIFGANDRAPDHAETYAAVGLPPSALDVLASLQPKRHYYITQRGEGARVVDFHLGPETLAFCGVSTEHQLKRVAQLRVEDPENWTERWLQEELHEH